MANITSTDYGITPLILGNNEYETAQVTVAANTTLAKGTVLIRQNTGKFAVVTVTAGETPTSSLAFGAGVAILPDNLENNTGSSADFNVRVIIAGKVNRNVLNAAGEDLTAKECDILRSQSIVALTVHNV